MVTYFCKFKGIKVGGFKSDFAEFTFMKDKLISPSEVVRELKKNYDFVHNLSYETRVSKT